MVKDHGRAEDVTQEVFVSALRRMRETEQPLAFKPWLYQIAKNSCIDAFRRSKRTEEVSYDADEGLAPADHSQLVGTGPSPDAAVAAKQDLDSLCGAFGGLSETHHEILVLRELEGLSYQEIGRRMGMSRPAVESTLFRARRRLTEEFDDIVSGARCLRIQGIIMTAAQIAAGHARHAPPRAPPRALPALPARGAGRRAGPQAVRAPADARARRHAGSPASCRSRSSERFRRGADASPPPRAVAPLRSPSHLPMFSDQLSSGWGKAAAGAAVLVAGVGAGVGVHHVATAPSAPPARCARRRRPSPRAAPTTIACRPRWRATRRRLGAAATPTTADERSAPAPRLRRREARRTRRPPPTGPRRPAADRRSPRTVHVRRAARLQTPAEPAGVQAPGRRPRDPTEERQGDARRRGPADQRRRQRRGPEDHRRRPRDHDGATGTVDDTVGRSRAAAPSPAPSTSDRRRRRGRARSSPAPSTTPSGDVTEAASTVTGGRRLDCVPPRGVAQPGSARRSGRRGPRFKSGRPDGMRAARERGSRCFQGRSPTSNTWPVAG